MLLADKVARKDYDFFVASTYETEGIRAIAKEIGDAITGAQVIVIDNVCEYYFQNPKEDWSLDKDFPNIAPPFEKFFVEMKSPTGINVNGSIVSWGVPVRRMGALFISTKPIDQRDAAWLVKGYLFLETTMGETWFTGMCLVAVDGFGRAIAQENGRAEFLYSIPPSLRENKEVQIFVWETVHLILKPSMLGVSFMHCKNVKIIPHDPAMNVHRRRVKPSPKPRLRYHTLEITPMKEVLRKEGGIDKNGLKMALHICRGHFKDYTERGLFGKVKGMFWWNDHVRGSAEEGVVAKDYKVNDPHIPNAD